MIQVLAPLRGLLRVDGGVCVDNWVFRVHGELTAAILIGCSVLVTSRQYFGEPINCIADGVPKDVMEAYCWIHSTYTVPEDAPQLRPGVGPYAGARDAERYHNYYQWVAFALFLQALAFCGPRFAWRAWEGGRVQSLVGADASRAMVAAAARDERKKLLLEYFAANVHTHRWYAARFFACELLNAVNAVAQALFMDRFFDGQFAAYGSEVLRQHRGDDDDPMSRVFPKMTKCTFNRFGASGTVQRFDGLCVLALNALNEKIFAFLWFYLLGLIAISACGLVYRLFAVTVPRFRAAVLRWNTRNVRRRRIDAVVRKCDVGDWFVLCQLRRNLNEMLFDEFLCELAEYLDSRDTIQIVPIRGHSRFFGNGNIDLTHLN